MNIEEVVEKIRKCIRLASGGATEGERAAAANRAKALAAAHGLDIDGIDEDTPIPVEVADEKFHTRTGIEQKLALEVIEMHFGVKSYWSRLVYQRRRQLVVWVGERVNIPIAQQIYVVVTRAARSAWEERKKLDDEAERDWRRKLRSYSEAGFYWNRPPRPVLVTRRKDARKQFMLGFFQAVNATLAARPLRNDSKRLAAERAANERFMEKRKQAGDIGEGRASSLGDFDPRAAVAGYDAGSKVNLSRPVSGTAQPTLRLAAGG